MNCCTPLSCPPERGVNRAATVTMMLHGVCHPRRVSVGSPTVSTMLHSNFEVVFTFLRLSTSNPHPSWVLEAAECAAKTQMDAHRNLRRFDTGKRKKFIHLDNIVMAINFVEARWPGLWVCQSNYLHSSLEGLDKQP